MDNNSFDSGISFDSSSSSSSSSTGSSNDSFSSSDLRSIGADSLDELMDMNLADIPNRHRQKFKRLKRKQADSERWKNATPEEKEALSKPYVEIAKMLNESRRKDDRKTKIQLTIFFSIMAVVFAGGIYMALEKKKAWKVYAAKHNCQIAGTKQGTVDVMPVINSNGGVGIAIGGDDPQVLYKCDNGTEHWKNK